MVDDHLLNPYFTFDFAPMSHLQALNLSVGGFVGYQRDRRWKEVKVPLGLDVVTNLRHWNFGVRNEFYWGTSLMPFYAVEDAAGVPYGERLYFRDPYWQVRTGDAHLPAVYDRLEAYWQPRLGDFLRIRIAAIAFFNHGFSGWQQTATLIFDLDTLLKQRNDLQMFPHRPRHGRHGVQRPETR